MRSFLFALSFFLLSVGAVGAAPAPEPISLKELTPKELQQRVENLKTSADKFANNRSVQRQFHTDIAELSARLEGQTNFEQFSDSDQVKIVNAYESLRARASNGDVASNRRICERIQRTGSHMTKTVCLTQAERDQIKRSSEESLIELQRKTPAYTPR